MKKGLFLWLFMAISALHALAQTRTITGKITDAKDGTPLPGVTVKIKNTTTGTMTNGEGTFTISVNGNPTLEISNVGYSIQQVPSAGRNTINVQLSQDEKALNEVVVVAYGTTTKASNTGSTVQIDSKKFADRPLVNVASALEGAAPGIQVSASTGQPGNAPSIRIRGFGSVNASSDPLYVVDGVPYSGDISNLNMNDVASISVLKDAAASSMYGSRAANGVVMITTKKGKKGKGSLQVRATTGISSRGIPEYSRVGANDYYPLMWSGYRNSLPFSLDSANKIASGIIKVPNFDNIKGLLGYNPFNVADNQIILENGTLNPNAKLIYGDDLNWEKAMTRTGKRGDYDLSYSGANDKTDYFVSLGYVKEKGYAMKSDYERVTGRVNINTQATSWFKTGMNLSGTYSQSNQAKTGGSIVNPFYFSRAMGPIYPVYAHNPKTGEYLLDDAGNRIYDLGGMTSLGLPNRPILPGRHIIAETEWNDNLFKRNVLSARTFGEISFLRDFKFTTNIAVDISNYRASTLDNAKVGDGAPDGRASRTSNQTTSYNLNQLLTYQKQIDKHSFKVLAGHENYDYNYNYFYGFRQGQIVDGNTELVNFTTTNELSSRTDRNRIESYLSRLDYAYNDKYIFSASFRRDGSSRFSKENRWGNFGAVSAAWRIEQESFIKSISWIDALKLRASYGTSGNDALLDVNGNPLYYGNQALYDMGNNNALEPGFVQFQLANNKLQWESNKNFDVGVDFAVLKNRLSGSIEYFNRQSSNLLFRVPLPLSSGMKYQFQNIGTMKNTGVELQLSGDVIRNKHVVWTMDINLTKLKNKFTKLPQDEIITGTKKLSVGHSLYDYWLKQYMGVDPTDGAALYMADNLTNPANRTLKDGTVVTTDANNAKYHYAGSAIPDVYGSLGNTVKYHNFDLTVLLAFQIGGKIYDDNYRSLMMGDYGSAVSTDMLKAWQKPGDITNVPRYVQGKKKDYAAASDRWLTDGSYLSIRSVRLGYTVPMKYAGLAHLQAVNIFVSGENLAYFSKRKGMNTMQANATLAFTGVTADVYSPARILSAGINVTL